MTPVHALVEVYALDTGRDVYRLRLPDNLPAVPGVGDHVNALWSFGPMVPVRARVVCPEFVLVTFGAWVVDPAPGFRHTTDAGVPIRTWRTATDGDLLGRMTAGGWTTSALAPDHP